MNQSGIKFSYCALLFLLALVLRADQTTAKQARDDFAKEAELRKEKGLPPLSIVDLYNRYNDDDKRTVLRDMALNNVMIDEIPNKWPLIDEASVALPWLRFEKEPLADSVLSCLERCLTGKANESEKFRINAVLYRYSKAAAKEYLIKKLLDNFDAEAAKILALNKEGAALEPIAHLAEKGQLDAELIYALGRWGDDARGILFSGLHKDQPYAPMPYLWALSMSEYKIAERDRMILLEYSKSESEIVRIAAIGVLLRQGNEFPGGGEYLLETVRGKSGGRYFAAWCLNQIDSSTAKETFRDILQSYLAKKQSIYFQSVQYEALVGLLRNPSEGDWTLALSVLRSLRVPSDLGRKHPAIPVAALIYKLGNSEIRREATGHVGNRVNLAIVESESLKRLPPSYLPESSRMVEWNHTDLGSGNSKN